MNFQLPDLTPMMPELAMTAFALIVMLLDLLIKKKEAVALISIAGVALVSLTLFGPSGTTFGTMFISDGYSTFFKIIFFINVILSILISIKYIAIEKVNYGEYYSLMLFSTIGMMIMASAGDLIVLYFGLELMALSTYVLAGFIRHDIKSNGAALKYFLLGAFSSAFLLYGISLATVEHGEIWLRTAIQEKFSHIAEIQEQHARREARRLSGFGLWGKGLTT